MQHSAGMYVMDQDWLACVHRLCVLVTQVEQCPCILCVYNFIVLDGVCVAAGLVMN